jgi:hypothetical protein
MVEYSYDEAIAMLEKSLKSTREVMVRDQVQSAAGGGVVTLSFVSTVTVAQRETDEDISHLKNQTTTLEVNMARVFNHDVKVRREKKQVRPRCEQGPMSLTSRATLGGSSAPRSGVGRAAAGPRSLSTVV